MKDNTDRNTKIVADRHNGLTLVAIGKRHGISRERVRQVLWHYQNGRINAWSTHVEPRS